MCGLAFAGCFKKRENMVKNSSKSKNMETTATKLRYETRSKRKKATAKQRSKYTQNTNRGMHGES